MNSKNYSSIAGSYNLAIIGTVGIPARYGGFETLAEQLTQRLSAHHSIQVFCSGKRHPDRATRPKCASGADLNYVEWDANGWQSIPYDCISIWRAAGRTQTILVLGVSGCLLLPLIRLLWPRTRIVTNVDGLEWKREKWGPAARAVLRISEWAAATFSHAVVSDNQSIRDHIANQYGRQSHLIAYGGDQAAPAFNKGAVTDGSSLRDTRFAVNSYFFAVCRIEPENHIADILNAFVQTPQANLVIVGNWNVSEYAERLRACHGNAANIELKDPIYDQTRLHTLRTQAKAYVHGHSAGGTNPSLVEAMFAGMPVFAYDIDYNRHSTHGNAIFWRDATELANRIRQMPDTMLSECATRMAEVAQRHYTWCVVTQQYADILFNDL